MSTIANWAFKNPLTFWSVASSDVYGQPTYARAYVLLCAFETVEALRAEGAIPSAEVSSGEDTYYFELPTTEDTPLTGWAVALGDHAGDTPPAGAKRIKSVTRYDSAMFGETIPDYKVMAA